MNGVPSLFPGRMCNVNARNKPERRVASSVMQAPLQRDRASSTLPHVQKALEATADQEALYTVTISQGNGERRGDSTDDVDEDGNKDGGSYGSSVFGVINTPDELLVAILVDKPQD